MPDLNFAVERVEPEPFAATPILTFKLNVEHADGSATPPIHAIALRCQIRIEPARRKYTREQQERLRDLFGPASQWAQTLRPMLWTHASTVVPAFTSASTVADLPVPCTYDFSVAATKYFDALGDDGEIPLCLLFSGTVFYQSDSGALQAAPISWEREAAFHLPARVWRELMDRHYPQGVWLNVAKETFDRLQQFKSRAGCVSWERAFKELLAAVDEQVVE